MKTKKPSELADVLTRLNKVRDQVCLTLITNTHRNGSNPDQDRINLKNLIKTGKEKLKETTDPNVAEAIGKKLDRLHNDVDFRNSQEGLVLFVNEEVADVVQVPFEVENRAIVDRSFATRDLLRALHARTSYLILVLSRKKARLIEALNDRVVQEVDDQFPVENTNHFPSTRQEAASGSYPTQLIRKFFNQVDDALHKVKRNKDLPIVVCTEKSNYPEFLKVTAFGRTIIGHLNQNRLNEPAEQIARDAWPIAEEHRRTVNRDKLELMENEYKKNRVKTDVDEIWTAIAEGRGRLLFVNSEYFQPAQITNENLCSLNDELKTNGGTTYDDVVDEMVERMYLFGGEAIFLDDEETGTDFKNLALITRY